MLCQCPCLHLVAEQLERLRPWAHEADPLFCTASGKCDVLTQEAIARMDGVASGLQGQGHDLLGVEVGRRARATQGAGLVRPPGVQ